MANKRGKHPALMASRRGKGGAHRVGRTLTVTPTGKKGQALVRRGSVPARAQGKKISLKKGRGTSKPSNKPRKTAGVRRKKTQSRKTIERERPEVGSRLWASEKGGNRTNRWKGRDQDLHCKKEGPARGKNQKWHDPPGAQKGKGES